MDEAPHPAQRIAQTAFDVTLAGALFAAPLFMGGRGPFGKFVFVIFVSCMALAWLVGWWLQPLKKRTIRWSGAEWVVCGGFLLVIAQLIPLPEAILLGVSPHMRDLLPVWFSSSQPEHLQIGQWQTISMAPDATRQALAVYTSYALFFFLIVQRIKRLSDAERLLKWIAYGAIGLAALGMAQLLVGNGKFLWFHEHPFRTTDRVVKGPFQNQNHFAQMMALAIGPLLWLLLRYFSATPSSDHRGTGSRHHKKHAHRRRGRQPSFHHSSESTSLPLQFFGVAFGAGLVAVSVMLTYSRGGFLAFFAAAAVALAIFAFQGKGTRRFWTLVAGTASIVFVSVLIHGYDSLTTRLSTLSESESLEELSHGRHALWNAMGEAIQLYWRGGTGIGSHADVYPLFMSQHYGVKFTHGESGYLPLLMESGILGIALLLFAVILLVIWIVKAATVRVEQLPIASQVNALAAPLAAAITASLVHSVGDFIWYITAPMSWTIVMIAVAARVAGIVGASGVTIATGAARDAGMAEEESVAAQRHAKNTSPWIQAAIAWGKRFEAVIASSTISRPSASLVTACLLVAVLFSLHRLATPALAATSWNNYRVLTRDEDRGEQESTLTEEMDYLHATIEQDPCHADAIAHLLLKCKVLESQNDAVSSERNQAAISAGRNLFYARQLLKSAPLKAISYFELAQQLEVKNGEEAAPLAEQLVQQAATIAKHDPKIQMLLGRRCFMKGRIDDGFRAWQIAFNRDPAIQRSLVQQLRFIFPATMLVERLQPETPGLWQLYYGYAEIKNTDSAQWLAQQLIDRLTEQVEGEASIEAKSSTYYQLHSLHRRLNQDAPALNYIEQAVRLSPEKYSFQYALATELMHHQKYEEAVRALRWCQVRRPEDANLAKLLKSCTRRSIANKETQSSRH